MPSYPGSVFPTPAYVDGVDTVLAAHPNALGAEVHAIEQELGTNPKTITDNASLSSSPLSVADYLDMVATRLRQIIGGGGWTDSVPASLTALAGSRISSPTGAQRGDILYHDGTGWVRLPIGEKPAALLGIVDGVPGWRLIDARPWLLAPASADEGGIMTYADGDWASLPAGANGTKLVMVDGAPMWLASNDIAAITQPAIYSTSARTWVQYPTIQAAINAVPNGSTTTMIVIPPGTYSEDLTLRSSPVVELIPGTVTIRGTVTMVGGCYLDVFRIQTYFSNAAGHSGYGIVVNDSVGTSVAVARVFEILLDQKLEDAGSIVHEGIRMVAGRANIQVSHWSNGTNYLSTVRLANVLGGTLNLHNAALLTNSATSWVAFEQVTVSGGTLNLFGGALFDDALSTAIKQSGTGVVNVHGVAYNRARVTGRVNQMRGDRAQRNYATAAFFNTSI